MNNVEQVVKQLVEWLQEKVKDANAKGVVFGLSGGVDSAVVAGIAKLAFGDNCMGIMMPCHSNPIDEEHAKLVAEALNLKTQKVDVSNTFDTLYGAIEEENKSKMAMINIKPRLRMTTLYYFAQNNNYLVLGGSNKSEMTVGYFTKFGDSGSDLLPIASFVKSEIRDIARYLNIPSLVIDKAPTAGLWEDQTDEIEMGFSYDVLDHYIKTGEGPADIVEKIQGMNRRSENKRVFPPIFEYKN